MLYFLSTKTMSKGYLFFNDMFFDAGQRKLKVRLRAEITYQRRESLSEEVSTKRYVITTLEDVEFGDDDERKIPLPGNTSRYAELVCYPTHEYFRRSSKLIYHGYLSGFL